MLLSMDTDKNYKASIKSVAKMQAERVMKKYGAGWERIGTEAQQNAIAHECLMGIFSSIDPNVEVQIARDIFNATMKAAGVEN